MRDTTSGGRNCRDQPQDVAEQTSRDGDLGHLEGDIAAVANDIRANLDKCFPQARQLFEPVVAGQVAIEVQILPNLLSSRRTSDDYLVERERPELRRS